MKDSSECLRCYSSGRPREDAIQVIASTDPAVSCGALCLVLCLRAVCLRWLTLSAQMTPSTMRKGKRTPQALPNTAIG